MTKNISAETLKKTIAYFYMLSFCPTSHIEEFNKASGGLRKQLAKEANMTQKKFFPEVIPQVSWRIAAFSQNSREPEKKVVDALSKTAKDAAKNAKSLASVLMLI